MMKSHVAIVPDPLLDSIQLIQSRDEQVEESNTTHLCR